MKRRNFTEKSKSARNNFAIRIVNNTMKKMEKYLIESIYDNLYGQWLYDEDVCAKVDENGETIYDEKEDWTIFDEDAASEIAESMYYECNGYYDKYGKFIELPSRTEMIENIKYDYNCYYHKEIMTESWLDTFSRMTRNWHTGLSVYVYGICLDD